MIVMNLLELGTMKIKVSCKKLLNFKELSLRNFTNLYPLTLDTELTKIP